MSTRLLIEAGSDTEALVRFIAEGLDDATLDSVEIDRKPAEGHGLANEVITTAVILTLGAATISAVTRLIERWLENKRQETGLRIVAAGFNVSDEAGKELGALERAHTHVSVTYGSVPASWATPPSSSQ